MSDKKTSKSKPYMDCSHSHHMLRGAARFNITREISDTLQGRIYGAVDLVTGRPCVVKEAWKQLVHNRMSRKAHRVPENFLHEREMLMSLSTMDDAHTGLVHGIGAWEDEHCYYIAMEYCTAELFDFISQAHGSGALFQWVQQQQSMTQQCMTVETQWIKTIKYMFKQIVECVSWMHERGFCHLDLSLENTMISSVENKTVKIIDLGLAKKFDVNSNFEYQGRVGKLQYMCPESYDRKQFDARSADVYCLGVMLFMMLIGAPPYPAPQRQNTAFRLCMSGRIRDVLKHWKRLRLVTKDALDLLTRIFRYESDRITIAEILQHPFLTTSTATIDVKQYKADVNINNNNNNTNMNVSTSHSQINVCMENQMSTDSAIVNSSSMSIGIDTEVVEKDTSMTIIDDDDDDGMCGGSNEKQMKEKPAVYFDHQQQQQQKQYTNIQQTCLSTNINNNMCQAVVHQHKACDNQPMIQPVEERYHQQQQQQRTDIQSVRQQSEQQMQRPPNPYFVGNVDEFGRGDNNNASLNYSPIKPGILDGVSDNDSKHSDGSGRSLLPLYTRLLLEWNLMQYNDIMRDYGQSDVSQWHLLNVGRLKAELKFEEQDANYFMRKYGEWYERNRPHCSPSTSELMDDLGGLIKTFSK